MDTKSYVHLFRFYRCLQGTIHCCNFVVLIVGLLLSIISAMELASHEAGKDASLMVRGGYLLAGIGSCIITTVGSGAELKSSQTGLIMASFFGVYVAVILAIIIHIEAKELDTISLLIDSSIEQTFRQLEADIAENKEFSMSSKVALTLSEYECCGWYSPLEFRGQPSNSYPDACCPQLAGKIVYSWNGNCTNENRFQQPCYRDYNEVFKTDLSTMNTLAIMMLPLSLFTAALIYTLSGYNHEFTVSSPTQSRIELH